MIISTTATLTISINTIIVVTSSLSRRLRSPACSGQPPSVATPLGSWPLARAVGLSPERWPLARAMAQKVGVAGIQARVVKTQQVQLDDISLASDSGWRDVDPHMVAQLKEKLMQGDLGRTTLGNPSIVCEQQQALTASDGKLCINNGKHIITALVEMKSLLEQNGLPTGPGGGEVDSVPDGFPWFVPPFRDVFTQGVRMDFVDYPVGCARSTHAAVQCVAHEAEMHNFQESAVLYTANSGWRSCA